MKSQTAAEAVAAARLAREGGGPPGHAEGLLPSPTRRPAASRAPSGSPRTGPTSPRFDFLLNEGAGAVMPYGDRRLYGVCVRREGHVPLQRAHPRHAPATPPCPASRDNALLKLAPLIKRLGARRPRLRPHGRAARAPRGARRGPRRPGGRARARSREVEPRLAALFEPTLRRHGRADDRLRGREDQRHPRPRAAAASTAASRPGWARTRRWPRIREVLAASRATRGRVHRGRSSATARRSTRR